MHVTTVVMSGSVSSSALALRSISSRCAWMMHMRRAFSSSVARVVPQRHEETQDGAHDDDAVDESRGARERERSPSARDDESNDVHRHPSRKHHVERARERLGHARQRLVRQLHDVGARLESIAASPSLSPRVDASSPTSSSNAPANANATLSLSWLPWLPNGFEVFDFILSSSLAL